MTVFISYDPQDTIHSAFGSTLDEAKKAAETLDKQLTDAGNHTHIDEFGHRLDDGLYGWNVMNKKIQYS